MTIKIAVQDDDMMPVSQLINRWAKLEQQDE